MNHLKQFVVDKIVTGAIYRSPPVVFLSMLLASNHNSLQRFPANAYEA